MFTPWELITMSYMNITNMIQNGTPLLVYQLSIPVTAHRTPVGVIADIPRPIAYDLTVLFFAHCFQLLKNTFKEQIEIKFCFQNLFINSD